MHLRVLALVERPRDTDIEIRRQRPADAEVRGQRVSSKSRKLRQRDQVWRSNQEFLVHKTKT